MCDGAHSLSGFLPHRSLTRLTTAQPRVPTRASAHSGGLPWVRRRASANARAARVAGRTDCRCRGDPVAPKRWRHLHKTSADSGLFLAPFQGYFSA
jgi:hypothetical protein